MTKVDVLNKHSMILVFHMGPVVSGRGLSDIDRLLVRFTKSFVKNWEVLARQK